MAEALSARRPRQTLEQPTLDDLAKQYKAKLDSIRPEGIERTVKLTRLEAGQILLTAKRRVDVGEGGMKWWAWFERHIKGPKYSRSNAEKLLKIAAAPDPQKAYDAEKQANKARMQAARAVASTQKPVLRKDAPTPVMDAKGRVTASADRCESCSKMIELKQQITAKYGPEAWNELNSSQ